MNSIARSKIYEVLASLTTKGAVHVARADTMLYGPLPPKELIDRLRGQAAAQLDAAEAAMSDYAEQVGDNAVIWDLQGRIDILDRTRQLIRSARRRILMEIWAPDAGELRADLRDAAGRRGIGATQPRRPATHHVLGIGSTLTHRRGGRP